ncbi:MAG TPA: CHAD domain-containing protein, partial [Daejeonella sp.]|nr:CHAD domain-containing protein [Daejeonella sp.]
MKKRKLKRLLRKRIQAIIEHLGSFLTTKEQDQLHQLRVQIKKLKSLLILLARTKGNKGLMKIFKPIKGVFHHAGFIRDAYIHRQVADSFRIKNSTFHQEQAEIMIDQTTKFCEAAPEYLKQINKVSTKLETDLKSIDVAEITNFYQSELDAVVLTLAKREFNNEMHECRKKLKNLLYNQKLFSKSLGAKFELNIAYLNKVQEALGQWHDSIVARDLFSNQLPGEQQAIDHLNLQIYDQEKAIKRITANFWEKVTSGNINNGN